MCKICTYFRVNDSLRKHIKPLWSLELLFREDYADTFETKITWVVIEGAKPRFCPKNKKKNHVVVWSLKTTPRLPHVSLQELATCVTPRDQFTVHASKVIYPTGPFSWLTPLPTNPIIELPTFCRLRSPPESEGTLTMAVVTSPRAGRRFLYAIFSVQSKWH